MRPLRMFPHSLTLPVLSLSAFTLPYDHTCLRDGQLAVTSRVAANFLPLNFKGGRHIKFAVAPIFCFGERAQYVSFSFPRIFKCVNLKKIKSRETVHFPQNPIRKLVKKRQNAVDGNRRVENMR